MLHHPSTYQSIFLALHAFMVLIEFIFGFGVGLFDVFIVGCITPIRMIFGMFADTLGTEADKASLLR